MPQRKKILVVDDSNPMRMVIREELESGGYEVIEAINGVEALVKTAVTDPPDLVTLDIEMPKMDGFTTCQKLRESHYASFFEKKKGQRLPVVFVTSQDSMEDRRRGFELGATDFVAKPFAQGELLAVVERILRPLALTQGMRVLVVDDSKVARHVVATTLEQEGLSVVEARDGQEAFDMLASPGAGLDFVITDLVMPKMDGITLCRKIRRELNQPDLPVLFLTALADQSELLNVFQAGASDYIIKPFAREELIARITVHMERHQLNKRLRDTISSLKKANAEIRTLSITDPLTGCFNRTYMNSHLPKEIARAMRYGIPMSTILCDLDHFKNVNDDHGHQVGDGVLVRFVTFVQSVIRQEVDWLARYGGEEFLIVLPETELEGATTFAERLRVLIAQKELVVNNIPLQITASFGVAGLDLESREGVPTVETLIRTADKNLYAAKQKGRNRVEADPAVSLPRDDR